MTNYMPRHSYADYRAKGHKADLAILLAREHKANAWVITYGTEHYDADQNPYGIALDVVIDYDDCADFRDGRITWKDDNPADTLAFSHDRGDGYYIPSEREHADFYYEPVQSIAETAKWFSKMGVPRGDCWAKALAEVHRWAEADLSSRVYVTVDSEHKSESLAGIESSDDDYIASVVSELAAELVYQEDQRTQAGALVGFFA